jgi:hypothetical protein
MRKQPKKLTLSRETLRVLEGKLPGLALGGVGGATTSVCACSNSACSVVCDKDPTCTGG